MDRALKGLVLRKPFINLRSSRYKNNSIVMPDPVPPKANSRSCAPKNNSRQLNISDEEPHDTISIVSERSAHDIATIRDEENHPLRVPRARAQPQAETVNSGTMGCGIVCAPCRHRCTSRTSSFFMGGGGRGEGSSSLLRNL